MMNLLKGLVMNIFKKFINFWPIRSFIQCFVANNLHQRNNIYALLFPLLILVTVSLVFFMNFYSSEAHLQQHINLNHHHHQNQKHDHDHSDKFAELGLDDVLGGKSNFARAQAVGGEINYGALNLLKSREKRFIDRINNDHSGGGVSGGDKIQFLNSPSLQYAQQGMGQQGQYQANINNNNNYKTISKQQLENWAAKFGGALFEFGRSVTKYSELQGRFQQSNGGEVKKIDLPGLVREFSNEFHISFKEKVDSIKKIANWVEEKGLEFHERKAMGKTNYYKAAPPIHNQLPDTMVDHGGYVADGESSEPVKEKKKKKKSSKKDKKSKKVDEEEQADDPHLMVNDETDDENVVDDESSSDDSNVYENAKKIPQLSKDYIYDPRFQTKINVGKSSVHVPTPIDYTEDKVKEAIEWSAELDELMKANFRSSPTLLWQYFGSNTGFLRQYPASRWPNDNSEKSDPDLYDARMRPWYVNAANSPKNMIILHDVSGSMTGLRREIAKHVVYTLLDTLTENDFVNVMNFSDDCWAVVPCFGMRRLVQANLENIREFKIALDQDRTAGIANFSSALNSAFDTLQRNFNEDASANCNQAIMLITDGSPYYFEEIFKIRQNPMHHARVFTYLIGRDQTDVREIKWMACSNLGYYVHVATLGEVQEQVLKYIPVMSRPMVMYAAHDVHWTPAYADIAFAKTTRLDYWRFKLRRRTRTNNRKLENIINYKSNLELLLSEIDDSQLKNKNSNTTSSSNSQKIYLINPEEIVQTDWLWDERQRQRQRRRSERYKEFLRRLYFNNYSEDDERPLIQDDEMSREKTNEINTDSDNGMKNPVGSDSIEKIEEWKNRIPNNIGKKKRRRRSFKRNFNEFGHMYSDHDHQNDVESDIFTTNPNTVDGDGLTTAGREKSEKNEIDEDAVEGDAEGGPKIIKKKIILTRKKVSTFLDTGLLTVDEYQLRKEQARVERVRRETRTRWGPERIFRFMISASYPVFDMRNSTGPGSSERIAHFLGVAGTDIDLKDLKKQLMPFKLGVNGYSFLVNNNGHIVFHPDWRPLIEEDYILKPNYNTVDLSEVEIVDDSEEENENSGGSSHENREFFKIYNRNQDNFNTLRKLNGKNGGTNNYRNNLTSILEMRREMVDQESSYKNLRVKIHRDDFKRVALQSRTYEYRKIEGTPYTLAISIATGTSYRYHGEIEIYRVWKDSNVNVTRFFTHPNFNRFYNPFNQMKNVKLMSRPKSGSVKMTGRYPGNRNWKVNPDWTYCEIVKFGTQRGHLDPEMFRNRKRWKEDLILEYLEKIMRSERSWAWRNTNVGISVGGPGSGVMNDPQYGPGMQSYEDIYNCDRELMQSLVFDANITQIFVGDDEYESYDEDAEDTNQFHHGKSPEGSSRRIKYIDKNESQIIQMYGALVAFVATRSGLTRWIHISNLTKRNLKGQNGHQRNKYKRTRRHPEDIDDLYLNDFFPADGEYENEQEEHENFMMLLNEQLEDIIGTKATDEMWYKRAVERYEIDPDSFVFSVPFDAGTTVVSQNNIKRTDTLVMATRAIFTKASNSGSNRGPPNVSLKQAPVGVVGILFNHSVWAERFTEITSTCIDGAQLPSGPKPPQNMPHMNPNANLNCSQVRTCASDEFDCFILDDNGFIMYSERAEDTGRFFGEVDGMVMEMLVNAEVYKRISVIDYQGVCLHPITGKGNAANSLGLPGERNYFNLIIGNTVLGYVYGMGSWLMNNIILSKLASFILHFELESGLFLFFNLLWPISSESLNGKKDSIRSALYHYATINDVNQNHNVDDEGHAERIINDNFDSIKYKNEKPYEHFDDDEVTVETIIDNDQPSVSSQRSKARRYRRDKRSKNEKVHEKVEFDFIMADDEFDESEHLIEEGSVSGGGGGTGINSLPFIEIAAMNKTRLRPCDKEYKLYTYGSLYNTRNFSYNGFLKKCGYSGCNGHFNVHYIGHTNLILVVTDGRCRCQLNATSIKPVEVNYVNRFLIGKNGFGLNVNGKLNEDDMGETNGKMSEHGGDLENDGGGSGGSGFGPPPEEKMTNYYEDWSHFYGSANKKHGEISGEIKMNGEASITSQICRQPLTQLYRKRPTNSHLKSSSSDDPRDPTNIHPSGGGINVERCYAYNPEESYLKEDCGGASSELMSLNFQIILSIMMLPKLIQFLFTN